VDCEGKQRSAGKEYHDVEYEHLSFVDAPARGMAFPFSFIVGRIFEASLLLCTFSEPYCPVSRLKMLRYAKLAQKTVQFRSGVARMSTRALASHVPNSHVTNEDSSYYAALLVASAAVPLALWSNSAASSFCEKKEELSPAHVGGQDDLEDITSGEMHKLEDLPVYSSEQVALNNGEDGRPIWMTYGGVVYDVTDFIPNHPGGDEKIMMAAGGVRPSEK
jgi:hypothetical protein